MFAEIVYEAARRRAGARDGRREADAGARSSGAARRARDLLPEVLHPAKARVERAAGASPRTRDAEPWALKSSARRGSTARSLGKGAARDRGAALPRRRSEAGDSVHADLEGYGPPPARCASPRPGGIASFATRCGGAAMGRENSASAVASAEARREAGVARLRGAVSTTKPFLAELERAVAFLSIGRDGEGERRDFLWRVARGGAAAHSRH